jgi:septum formation protein
MSLILASKSKARQNMLKNAGIDFESYPANLDEENIIKNLQNKNASPENIALTLAQEKALFVSKKFENNYIIGSDQLLSMNRKIYSKAKTKEEAIDRLLEFQGKEHCLTSAVAVAKAGKIIWHKTETAILKMKSMDRQDIEKYSKIADNTLTSCVGCYAIEEAGIRLFEGIKGDYFTVLGMPLLPLLNFLESEGVLS